MNKRRLFILTLSVICVVIVALSFLYWSIEQMSEQKLQFYMRRLENKGIIVEEQPLQGFSDDEIIVNVFWNDFDSHIETLQIIRVYYDRGKRLLYFIRPYPRKGYKIEAFSCQWKITDLFS